MTKKIKLSIIIIAKNEEEVIEQCLESVKWAEDIVFLDTGSTDKTRAIAQKYKVNLTSISSSKLEYAQWRNQGLKLAKGEWVFYVDADERVTPELKDELWAVINKKKLAEVGFTVPRRNFLLGKELHYGGWWPDYVKRVFRKKNLHKWVGQLHEEPVYQGQMGQLAQPLIHLQPQTIEPALQKTIRWSKLEAQALLAANHPPVVWWRILRMGLTTFWDRLVKKQGFRDGTEGWIESIFQVFHTIIVYIQLWEIQNQQQNS